MQSVLWILAGVLFAGSAKADDIIFAAAKLRDDDGIYFPLETSHLYRIHNDGSHLTQLTFGDWQDSAPYLSPDRKTILFLRRDKHDLAGTGSVCSIGLDGSHEKTLHPSKKSYVLSQHSIDEELAAASSRKPFPQTLPSIRSSEGGESDAISVAWLDEHTLVCGFYGEDKSLLGITPAGGGKPQLVKLFQMIKGKKQPCEVFDSNQWAQNGDGSKAFRFDKSGREILLQGVARTNDGGSPTLYCFQEKTGQVRFELKGQFLEDADPKRDQFLTVSWKWGHGTGVDGAVPLRKLTLWDGQSVHSRQLAFPLMGCEGACFVPSN